ncbi:MAG TPA: hypothetical protein ACQGQJ_11105 [Xylella fastidiosa subsp. multiplex]|uniref:Uncharacterized protein n=1 Tax=Xylella fastidiosa subsp. multiplex TaxID=644357 RepID=A0AAW6HXS7_XYLFS|nr:hypothetical protein [Xylella fastidiosa]MDC6409401.1 hypothetical protein [Xylella fastidiosa subsp. multiplex]MDD0934907.1 hypothetical protein [Xylella fastidiosa subsp. multiplex]MSS69769.1 hypothetical protein [Xylella fastidiosa subsp. multiplex]
MVNLTSLERVLNIKLKEYKEYIAAHHYYVIGVFIFLPMIVSKIAILIGVTNIGFVSPWEISYRTAFGGAEGYTLTMVMYWVMSPLVFLWAYSKANYKKVPLKKAIVAIPVCWLLLIVFGVFVFEGVSASSLEHPVKSLEKIFLYGRWYVGFCLLYGGLVFAFIFNFFATLSLTLRLIFKRL